MLAPYAVGSALLFVVPAAITFGLALFEADLLTAPRFVGLDNFARMFDDPIFPGVLRQSLLFVAIAVPVRLALATGFALLLHRNFRAVAYALVWLFLLNPVYGPMNGLLELLGFEGVSWLSNRTAAFAAIVMMLAFTMGESFIVALAARQEVPAELGDVARLEGASRPFVARRVTLPLMAPILGLLAARDVAVALQASFSAAYLLTDGGPDRATLLLPIYIFDVGFEQLTYGYAAAITLVMFLLTASLALLQYRLVRRWRLDLTS